MKNYLALALSVLVLTACGGGDTEEDPAPSEKGSISGFVTENDSGAVVKDVSVKVLGKESVTGDDGVYTITDIDTGEVAITAIKSGFTNYSDKIPVSDGQTTSHDIVLSPAVVTLHKSCLEILNAGESIGDGFYAVDADADGSLASFDVYCDMTNEGGGWTLFANHEDNVQELLTIEKVSTTETGLMTSERWKVLRDSMTVGMLFIDENQKISVLSKDKLDSGNCSTPSDIDDLSQLSNPSAEGQGQIWHNENFGCLATGQDYSIVQLLGENYSGYEDAGAALYQLSNVKFDVWPYQNQDYSFIEQDKLLYFIK